MPRVTARHAAVLALAAIVLALAGCGGASAPSETAPAPVAPESGSGAAPEAQSAELPPAPSDASGMQGWLAEAYPDAAWLARITSIEHVPGEVPDSGGFANAIVVGTDLDFASEQPLADQIAAAIGEAHPTWAKQLVVRYADGNNITAGDIFDRTP